MKCIIYPLILIFSSCLIAEAQIPQSSDQLPKIQEVKAKNNSNKLFFLVKESFPLDEKKRQFLKNEFIEGIIIDFENEPHQVSLRYRFFDDEMQVMHLNNVKALQPQSIRKVIFQNTNPHQVFVPTEYFEKHVKNLGFFELKSQGKITLLKAFRGKGKTDITTKYFYQKKGTPAQLFKLKKSDILKIFKDKKSEVSKFIVKQKLNVKKEEDLVKIFDFYNSIN